MVGVKGGFVEELHSISRFVVDFCLDSSGVLWVNI